VTQAPNDTTRHSLSRTRVRFALLALALGGFAIGCTEFVAMGLLPNIAGALLPAQYAVSPSGANASAGLLVSAYAAGVVVGAPTIAALAARYPRKKVLLWLLVALTLATVASAVLPTFGWVLAARFVAGLPHGAYFGVAALVAASLMGPNTRGRGVALVLGGLTVANVIGVPAITFLGERTDWRVAYLAVAGLFALTFLAVLIVLPPQPGDPQSTVRAELAIFRRPQVWFALGMGAIGFGGFFAVYTFVAPIVTNVTGLPEVVVPVALVVAGIGMTIGNFIGGWVSDHHLIAGIFIFFGALAFALLGIALTAQYVIGVFVFLFLVGAASAALSPAIQTRLMNVAGDRKTLAAAVNHASLNIGNSIGAALGGIAVAMGLGYLAAPWVGLVLCGLGILLAAISVGVERRHLHRAGSLGLQKNAVLDGSLT
jgi:DHA1 family inner membrane transport protein